MTIRARREVSGVVLADYRIPALDNDRYVAISYPLTLHPFLRTRHRALDFASFPVKGRWSLNITRRAGANHDRLDVVFDPEPAHRGRSLFLGQRLVGLLPSEIADPCWLVDYGEIDFAFVVTVRLPAESGLWSW
ncbi:hypothetical protein JCM8097_007162 [Rhodosporidiobolus ruineniae]